MSAIVEELDGANELVKVLITLHEGMDTMDACGPLEVFSWAQHDKNNSETKAFEVTIAAAQEHTTTLQGITLGAHVTFDEAMKRLAEFDVVVIPGGGHSKIIEEKAQPLGLIKKFAEIQTKDPARERTLMSVCTGSFLLGEAGILAGLSATTHPDFILKFENLCSHVAVRDMTDRWDVVEERYVVNNLRFDVGEDAYVMTRKEYKEYKRRRSSLANIASPIEEHPNGNGTPPVAAPRKGSTSWRASNKRRESALKRSNLRLGGLRVLTTSGVTSGIDGALYMVAALVDQDAAEEVARLMCHKWHKGMVVSGTDV